MTTATQTSNAPHRSSFARVPAAFRLQFAVPYSFIWLPMFIFMLAWALGIGIGFFIDAQMPDRVASQEPLHSTGASQATIWYLAFMAAYSASHTFPFSLALSYSRRVYLIGTHLTFLVVAAGYGVAAMLAYYIERVTDGFGKHIYVFGMSFMPDYGGGFGLAAAATVLVMFFMCFGFFWAILYRRTTILILWAVIIGVIVAVLGSAVLVTHYGWWPNIGQWFVTQNAFSLAGWGALAVAALTAVNYGLIRKVTA